MSHRDSPEGRFNYWIEEYIYRGFERALESVEDEGLSKKELLTIAFRNPYGIGDRFADWLVDTEWGGESE